MPDDPRTRLRHALLLEPATAPELMARLGASQPSVSRWLRSLAPDVVVGGKARATRYGLRRSIDGVLAPVPVFEIGRRGEPTRLVARLTPVAPRGFHLQALTPDLPSGWFDDLPWFFYDLRPTGYLGRQLARAHPELRHPPDVRLWSSDQVLRYLVAYGSDGTGAFVLGHEALDRALAQRPVPVARVDRPEAYVAAARDALGVGPVGSSAAGEEPKFLGVRRDPDGALVPVLVKFSPPTDTAVGRRRADLLVAEHLALATLRDHGHAAARSELVEGGGRMFLEVERFDREGVDHRVGQVALEAADAALVGRLARWSDASAGLSALGLLSEADHREVRALELFGGWIANTDMHLANLSLRLRGGTIGGLCPVYDMLPMAYAPVAGEVVPRTYALPTPQSADADVAPGAHAAAVDLWDRVARDPRIGEDFRAIARGHLVDLTALGERLRRLPKTR